MAGLFGTLHHICVVVRDLERSVAYYESIGVGPWHAYGGVGTPYVMLDVPDPEGSAALRYLVADMGNYQLQLCQPSHHLTPQRRFLDTHGEGVFHLGFEVPDVDAAADAGRGMGMSLMGQGRRVDGSGFCYFDTAAMAGVVLEVRRTPPTGRSAGAPAAAPDASASEA